MKTPKYDLHIHTHLSLCSLDPEQNVENILRYAAANHIGTICISDHVWDCDVKAGSDFYLGQPFSHIEKIKETFPKDTHGVRLLFGAETEFASGKVALDKKYIDQLDFLLVPHSHTHMVGLVLPEEMNNHEGRAKYLVDSFCDLVSQDIADSIAHPFGPVGLTIEEVKMTQDLISDEDLYRCFTLAKAHDTALEINGSSFGRQWEHPEYLYNFERIFSIARDCGCMFTLGSDAHHLSELSDTFRAIAFAEKLGIADDRFIDI